MSNVFDIGSLATNEALETEGVWRELPKGAGLKIARWQNAEFAKLMRRKFKDNRDLLEADDDLSDKVGTEVLIEVMAITILKDVRNIAFEGVVIEKYTPEIGRKLLAIKDFREKVKTLSEQVDQYRDKKEQQAVNS